MCYQPTGHSAAAICCQVAEEYQHFSRPPDAVGAFWFRQQRGNTSIPPHQRNKTKPRKTKHEDHSPTKRPRFWSRGHATCQMLFSILQAVSTKTEYPILANHNTKVIYNKVKDFVSLRRKNNDLGRSGCSVLCCWARNHRGDKCVSACSQETVSETKSVFVSNQTCVRMCQM